MRIQSKTNPIVTLFELTLNQTPEAAAVKGRDSLYDTWHIAQTISGGSSLRHRDPCCGAFLAIPDSAVPAGPLILHRVGPFTPVSPGVPS